MLLLMALEGWNHIPRGYGAEFDVHDAPRWLRVWARTAFVDRYAYPRLVARGFAFLTPHPDSTDADREAPRPGWRFRPEGYQAPGSTGLLISK